MCSFLDKRIDISQSQLIKEDENINSLELLFKQQFQVSITVPLLHRLILSYINFHVFHCTLDYYYYYNIDNQASMSQILKLSMVCKPWMLFIQKNIDYLSVTVYNSLHFNEYYIELRDSYMPKLEFNAWSLIQTRFIRTAKFQFKRNESSTSTIINNLIGAKENYGKEIISFVTTLTRHRLELLEIDIDVNEFTIDFVYKLHSCLTGSQKFNLYTRMNNSFTSKLCDRFANTYLKYLNIHLEWKIDDDNIDLQNTIENVLKLTPVSLLVSSELLQATSSCPRELYSVFKMKSLRNLHVHGFIIDPDEIYDNIDNFITLDIQLDPNYGDHDKFHNRLKARNLELHSQIPY